MTSFLTNYAALLACALAVGGLTAAPLAQAQMPAFPGAEGAGKYTTGGRGGDVYHVTNLNDSGPGSLRHGLENSGNGPLTVVFDVAGIIPLESEIRARNFNGLTIAGQTAPGGGITIANSSFWIRDSQNVIVQHLRFAPGDALTKPGSESLPGHFPGGDPRSLRLWNVQNAIVDHVTTRWGAEDNLSVTTHSGQITVQNSFIAEGLHHADHHKGERGYSSLLNGGHISFLNNLYAQNRSRNPRVQNRSDQTGDTHLEFSNNVLYNARNRYGAASETVRINFERNLAINGPNSTSSSPPAMMRIESGPALAQIYHDGNHWDRNAGQPLDLDAPSGGPIVQNLIEVGSPLNISDYQATSVREAYIHVLSRAGAARTRDHHDRRLIRDVMQRGGGYIDRPDEVGGYGTVDAGVPVVSTAQDGIADWWKQAHGLDTNVQYHQVDAGDGYTFLEKYLHSLNEPYLRPAGTETWAVSTAFGSGADAQVNENDHTSSGNGTGPTLNARFNNATRNEYSLLKFDLTAVQPGSITDAHLDLTSFRDMSGTNQLRVYGLIHDAPGWEWDEQTVDFATAPGLAFDGDSTTRGLVADDLIALGSWNVDGLAEGDVASFDHPNLAVFLNLAADMEGQDQAGMVTLLIEKTNITETQTRFASKDATHLESTAPGSVPAGTYAPRLVVDALLAEAAAILPGDFNADGTVDAADYVLWRDRFGADFTLDDYHDWRTNFGATTSLAAGAAGTVVPEPGTWGLLIVGTLALERLRRRPRGPGRTNADCDRPEY